MNFCFIFFTANKLYSDISLWECLGRRREELLTSKEAELLAIQAQLETARADLSRREAELERRAGQLAQVQQELEETTREAERREEELERLRDEKESIQACKAFIVHWNPSLNCSNIKGTVQQDFRTSFFHNSNLPGPLTNGLKYFRFWLRIRRVIQIFRNLRWDNLPEYHTPVSPSPRGFIPRGVNLPRVCDSRESLRNPESPHPFIKTFA